MKRIKILCSILVLTAIISGCNEDNNQKPQESPSIQTSPVSTAENGSAIEANLNYYENEQVVMNEEADKVIEIGKYKISTSGEQILITGGNKEIPIAQPSEFKWVTQVALSPDEKFVALEALQLEGEKTYIVDLTANQAINVSEDEVVSILDWSPTGENLALSVGRIAQQNLALYSVANSALNVLTDESYITILKGKWTQDSEYIDIIAEKPSDTFNKYRYDVNKRLSEKLGGMTRDEVNKW
jgi:hypothetical protein